MKVTVACVVAAHVPLVATFTPGYSRHRSTLKLFAANEDVPDIVKAYKKVKAEPKFPDLPTIPENPSLEPVVVLPEPVPVPVPVSAPLPELKVELPVETPPSPEIPSVVSDSIESMKESLPGMNMKETADKINAQFKGLNDFMKATQEQVAVHSSERGSNNVPTLGEMMQNGLVPKRATFTETTMLPQGKAPTLVEYVLGGFKSPTGGVSRDGLAETKAHLGLMVENTFSLFGNKAPDNVHLNLPGNMAPETATGLAFVSLAVLVIAGQNNKRPPAPQKFEPIEEDEGPLSDLAKDVVSGMWCIKIVLYSIALYSFYFVWTCLTNCFTVSEKNGRTN